VTDAALPLRILLLDDHVLFAQGLSRLLGQETDLRLVGHCTHPHEALAFLDREPVDLLLLDVDLGNERGTDVLKELAGRGGSATVLVLTAGVSDAEIAQLFELGAAGICFKDQPLDTLVRAIRAVTAGEAWMDQRLLAVLARSRGTPLPPPARPFSDRERRVLRGVFEGLANKEIGAQLRISESSVKAALQQLFEKTGVRTRSQLVRIVLERYRDAV
jgi:two-component system, NarL family, nitrate/nitrite response regulator NarL